MESVEQNNENDTNCACEGKTIVLAGVECDAVMHAKMAKQMVDSFE